MTRRDRLAFELTLLVLRSEIRRRYTYTWLEPLRFGAEEARALRKAIDRAKAESEQNATCAPGRILAENIRRCRLLRARTALYLRARLRSV